MIIIDEHKKNIILFAFLFLPHLKTDYFETIPVLETVTNAYRVITILIVLFYFVVKKLTYSLITVIVGIAFLYQEINTIIQEGDIHSYTLYVIGVISVMLIIDMGVQIDPMALVKSQLFCFELLVYINLVTEFAFPKGLYTKRSITGFVSSNCWFLGYYNQHTRYYIPLFLLLFLYAYIEKKYKRVVIDTLVVLAAALKVWSGGVLVSIFVMCLGFLFIKGKKNYILYYFSWIMQIGFLVMILLFDKIEVFSWVVSNILKKGSTLILRIKLWKMVVKWINERVIFGYGTQTSIVRTARAHMNWASGAHNLILETLYRGGIIYLFLFVVVIIIVGNRIKECENNNVCKALVVCFMGWGMHALVDVNTAPSLMALFSYAYYGWIFGHLAYSNHNVYWDRYIPEKS